MATRAEHYLEAERLIAAAADWCDPSEAGMSPNGLDVDAAHLCLAFAQVHAQLAATDGPTATLAQHVAERQ